MTMTSRSLALATLCIGLVCSAAAHAADVTLRVEKGRKSSLSTAVSGVVKEIAAMPGQDVKSGQLLLRLDPRVFAAQVEAARAEVSYRDLMLKEAQAERNRLSELNERKMLSEHEMTMGNIAVADAQRHYAAAQSALARAESDFAHSEIRAPYAATVVATRAEVGQFVQVASQAAPLIDIAESGRLIARAAISAAQATRLSINTEIHLLAGAKRFTGVVSELYAGSGYDAWNLVVSFDAKNSGLAPGKQVTLQLP